MSPAGKHKLDVLFVSAQRWDAPFGYYSEGIAILSALLKQRGLCVDLHLVRRRDGSEGFAELLAQRDPALVAHSILSPEWPLHRELLAAARRETNAYLIAGGTHPTFAPEQVFAESPIDALCIGEGDVALPELAQAVLGGEQARPIANIAYRPAPGEAFSPPPLGPLFAPLDELPEPDRELYQQAIATYGPSETVTRHRDRVTVMPIRAGRGCPYQCTYCANAGLSDLLGGADGFLRLRSPASLVAEVVRVRGRYPDRELLFFDEMFPAAMPWLESFAARMQAVGSPPFGVVTHCAVMDETRARLLALAGCRSVAMGVECGNERYRREVLGRSTSNRRILAAFRTVAAAGMSTLAFVMLGLPHETDAMLDETVAFVRELAPDILAKNLFQPLPGSQLYERCDAADLLLPPPPGEPDPLALIRHVALTRSKLEATCRELGMDVG